MSEAVCIVHAEIVTDKQPQSKSNQLKKSCRRFSSNARRQKNHQFPFHFLHDLVMARPLGDDFQQLGAHMDLPLSWAQRPKSSRLRKQKNMC